MAISLERISPRHSRELVALHRAVFPAEQVARTIYCSDGVAEYLAVALGFPGALGNDAYWGAWADERLIGYVHCRVLPDSYHLNHVAVHPDFQGAGVGRRLWLKYVQSAEDRGISRLTLDVDQSNQVAFPWYSRKGFRVTGSSGFYAKTIQRTPAEPAQEAVRVLDWPESEACQQKYGFSRFRLVEGEKIYSIGRLASACFRIEEPLSPTAEASLHSIDAMRRLLLITQTAPQDDRYQKVALSYRMTRD